MSRYDERVKKLREKYGDKKGGVTSTPSNEMSVKESRYNQRIKSLQEKYSNPAGGVTVTVPQTTDSTLTDWYKGVEDISNRGYSYLSKEGWREIDAGILDEIDKYLSQYDDIERYLLQNRSDFNHYHDAIGSVNETVDYLKKMREGIVSTNETLSKFKSEDEYNQAVEEYKQWYEKWGHYMDADDFQEYSAQGAAIKNPTFEEAEDYGQWLWWTWGQEDIGNIVTYSRDNADMIALAYANNSDARGNHTYRSMTDEEVNIYNYLLAKGLKLEAAAFLSYLRDTLNAREGSDMAERITGIENPILDKTATYAFGAVAGIDNWASGVKQFFTNEEQPISVEQYASSHIAESLNGFDKYAYQAANTIGNMAPSILLSSVSGVQGIGVAAMSTSAAGNAYGDALRRGYDVGQARAYSTLVGASEGTLQYLIGGVGSLGGMSGKMASKIAMIDNSLLRVAAKYGVSLGSEIVEEELQNFLEPAFRTIVFGEDYDAPTVDELIETAIVTAISTGVLEGGGTIGGDIQNSKYYKSTYGDSVQDLVMTGLESPEGSFSHNLAARYQAKLDAGNELNGHQIGRMVEANEQQFRSEDFFNIQNAAEARLTDLGETGDVSAIAAALAKRFSGEKLTNKEYKLIQGSKYGRRVSTEMNPANIRSGEYSTAWAENIGTERINAEEYSRLIEAAQLPQEAAEATGEQVAAEVPKAAQAQQTEVAEESEASMDSKTFQKSTGKEVQVKQFSKVGADGTTVVTDSGETISLSDVSFDDETEAVLFQSVASFNNITPDAANTILYAFRSGENAASAVSFVAGAAHIFKSGYHGTAPASEYTSKVSNSQADMIYNAGRKAAADHYKAAQEKVEAKKKAATEKPSATAKNGGVYYGYDGQTIDQRKVDDDHKKLTKAQSVGVDFTKRLSKKFGMDIYFYESYVDADGNRVYMDSNGNVVNAEDGFYDPKDGSIHIDLNAGGNADGYILFTVAHELVHFVKDLSPKHFNLMADIVVKGFTSRDVPLDKLIADEQDTARERDRELTEDEAFEEVIAHSLEGIMADGKVMEFMSELEAKDKSLWSKVKQFFRDVAQLILDTIDSYRGVKPDSIEGRMIMRMEDVYAQLQEVFAEGVYEAGENFYLSEENGVANDGELRYSRHGKVFFKENVFPPCNESHSEAHELAERWAKSEKTYSGDCKLISYHGQWYLIEAFDDLKYGYQIIKKLTKQQYNREALYYGTITGYQSLQNTSGENAALFREAHSDTGRRHSTDSDASQHGGPDHSLYGMGSTKNQRGNTGNDSSRNLPGSSSDTQRENGPSVTPHSNPTITENDSAATDTRKFSARKSTVSGRMTDAEIQAVQSIGRKSVNAFSAADIKATERFARRYWQEMGTKSPFFRAWFGDWRASDQTPVQVATQKRDARGVRKNKDTGWAIQVSSKVFNETQHHTAPGNRAARPYLPYINDIIKNAVLLDSHTMTEGKAKSANSLLMHSFYAVADIGYGQMLVKLYVEEMNNPNQANTSKRAYQLQNIEISSPTGENNTKSSGNALASLQTADVRTVADLFAIVKRKDKAFNPKLASKVVNPDGTPLVVYHGSAEEFNAFSYGHIGSASGTSILGEGFYFTDQRKLAKNYGQTLYPSYLQMNNPYYATEADAYKLNSQTLAKQGYDGVILKAPHGTVYMVFNNTQSKSATDNIGTFDGGNPDIRYASRKHYDTVADMLRKENEKLKKDVVKLNELLKLQRTVTNGTKFTPTSVEAAARLLKKQANAVGNTSELTGLLNAFYEYIVTEKELTWDGVKEQAQEAVDWLQDHVKQQRSEYAQEILDQLHGSRIYLDESQKAEVAYRFGSFNEFRKTLMGSITIANDANMSLDSLWHEMSSLYPYMFDPEMTASDMPGALADIVDQLRNEDTSFMEYEYNRDLIAQNLIRQVYDSYWNVSTLRTFADVKQAQINRLKGEHIQRINKLKAENREKVEQIKSEHRAEVEIIRRAYRQSLENQQKELFSKYQESRKRDVENRHKTVMRRNIRKVIRDLDKILKRGNKQRNVKEDIQPVVTKALQAAEILFTDNYGHYDMLRNGIGADMSDAEEALVETCTRMLKDLDKMPTDGYDNWQAYQEAESRLKTKMSKLSEVFARERKRLNNTKVSSILGELADAYKGLEDSDQSYVQGAYSEPVYNFLKNLQSEVGGTIVKDMSKDQLESVYAAYKMVLNIVRKANQMFNEELKMSREQLGNAVIEEVIKAGGVHLLGTKMGDAVSQFSWNNMKPIWLANRIGSETFGKLLNGLFKGQYNFAMDVEEVKQFKLAMDKKYRPRNWDAKKLYEFESSTGKKFSLNLQQIMSLYAFSKREQAYSHLLNGGFVFEDNSTVVVDGKLGIKRTYIHKGATSHKLNEATLNGIINSLTAEQKAYVDEMQKYLSDVMGAKGNEVSMQLYGIKMFNEQFYFPLRSSGDYMERAKEAEMKKEQGQINLVNSGFTHAVKPKASNPIILSGFMDVWSEHCNEMSMYHSMVLPMEDFRKVYNYSTPHEEGEDSYAVQVAIKNAYGKAATDYLDQLYRELNAGATIDPREAPFKKTISNFKKAAVMLSGSVVVQQFSSVGRAFAIIDPKYFIGAKVKSGTNLSVVEEMKKYAPVAIVKEMGGFDTGTRGNAKSYIMAEKYGIREWREALKDEQFRGDLMGYLPAKADELIWCAIWEAAKRETKANNPKMDVKSDEFLNMVGDRFSEVIEKTQVYDSVLARSANMRSKGNFMSMATAFMAEPTTTANLVEDAIRSGKTKNIARVFGSVAVSIILNNALASIIYAMRDDDEDETFLEKYFQSFTSGMIDDINPMSYYPVLKDVYSLFQGHDVERSDMSVIADVRDAMKKLVTILGKDTTEMNDEQIAEHNKLVNEVFLGLLDAGCSMFGVPVKNVRRDAMGIINAWNTIGKDLSNERDNSWHSFWDKVGAAAKDTIPIYAWTKDAPKTDKLYEAMINGDTAYLNRIKGSYKTEDAYARAVRKALRENDPRIKEAAQAQIDGDPSERVRIAKLIIADGFNQDDVVMAINAEINDMTSDDSSSGAKKAKGYYDGEDFAREVANGDKSAISAAREDIVETAKQNGKSEEEAKKYFKTTAKAGFKALFEVGEISRDEAEAYLIKHCELDTDDAYWTVEEWEAEDDNWAKYNDFYTAVETGKDLRKTIKTYMDNGVEAKTLAGRITAQFKPIFISSTTAERAKLKGYLLNAYELLGYDRGKKAKDIDKWLEE